MSDFLKKLFCIHVYTENELLASDTDTIYDDRMERMSSGYDDGEYINVTTNIYRSKCCKCPKVKVRKKITKKVR